MGESAEGGEPAFEHPPLVPARPAPDAETPKGPSEAELPEDARASPEEATHGPRQKPSYVMFGVLAALSAIADLASKAWAQARLTGYDPSVKGPKRLTVIDGYFDFVYAQNPGGAWSMLRGLPEIIRRPFFLFVSAVAIVFIVSIYARVDVRQRALRWGLPLALGGAIGNLVDRMRFGYVVDFIHFWAKYDGGEYHWPTFNVADVAIVLGVALMAVDLLFAGNLHESDVAPASGDAEPASQTSPEDALQGHASQDDSSAAGEAEEPPAPSSQEALDASPK